VLIRKLSYDYILIVKWNSDVSVGDVMSIDSSIFNAKLVVNRMSNNFEYYIYIIYRL
jgi:hypothetical protein